MKHLTKKVPSVILIALILFVQTFSNLDDASGQISPVKFNIKTVNVEDDTIQGYAYPGKMIMLKVNDQTYGQPVDQTGHFQFKLKDTIQQKDQLTLIQGKNEIDVQINPKDTPRTFQKAEAPFNSVGLPSTNTTKHEKQAQQEPQSEYKAQNDTTEEKNIQKKDMNTEQAQNKQQSSTSEKSEATEVDKEETLDNPIIEDKNNQSNTQPTVKRNAPLAQTLATQKDDNNVTFDNVPSISEYNQQINVNSDGPFRYPVQGKIVAVDNRVDFENALRASDIEVIILKNDMSNLRSQTIYSNSSQKVIEANHHSISMDNNHYLTKSQNSLTNIVIRNASNLYSSTTNTTNGFFRMTTPTDVNIVNSHFNSGFQENAGNVGTSWESTLHFYGQNSINYTSTSGYATYYRYIQIHDGASLKLNSSSEGFYHYSNGMTHSVAPPNMGVKIGDHSRLSMDVAGTAIFLTGNNRPYEFSVGNGSEVNIKGANGFYGKTNGTSTTVNIGNNSQVNIDTTTGPTFRMSNLPFSFSVGDKASLHLQSNTIVISSSGYNNTSSTFKFGSQSNVTMNKKDTSINETLFDFGMPSQWDIGHVKKLDLNNGNGRLFGYREHTFNVDHAQLKGWLNTNQTEQPNYYVEHINNGQFTLTGTRKNTTSNLAIQYVYPRFNIYFSSQNLTRLQVAPYIIGAPKINEPVYDNAAAITGEALANAKVSVTNKRTHQTLKTQSNASGRFSFDQIPSGWLKYRDTLIFHVSNGLSASKKTKISVKGNILRLLKPRDIQFEKTPIQYKPNQIIKRQANSYQVQVQNTLGSRNWSLNVKADHPLSSPNGVLNNALFFASTPGQFQSIENQAIKIGDANSASPDSNQIQTIEWDDNTGILMKMNPIDAAAGDYQTDLMWTLTDGP